MLFILRKETERPAGRAGANRKERAAVCRLESCHLPQQGARLLGQSSRRYCNSFCGQMKRSEVTVPLRYTWSSDVRQKQLYRGQNNNS